MICLLVCRTVMVFVIAGSFDTRPDASTTGQAYQVERVTPEVASSPMWESHPALDPWNGDLWFVRSKPDFSGWKLLVSRCIRGQFQEPTDSPISGPGLEADPYFDTTGNTLYFISSRASGSLKSVDLDIWMAKRDVSKGWSDPIRMPEPVNSNSAEWFPRPGPDGWLYFGSRRPGGLGKDDIWKAKQKADGVWFVENAGAELNTENSEYEFLPSPNGRWGLLSTDKGLFRVVRTKDGWRRSQFLGPEINSGGTAIGPMLLGSDGTFVFSRDAGPDKSGELFVAKPQLGHSQQRKPDLLQTCGTAAVHGSGIWRIK